MTHLEYRFVDEMQPLLVNICQDLYDLSGWTLVCLIGGPQPSNDGMYTIKTYVNKTFHYALLLNAML